MSGALGGDHQHVHIGGGDDLLKVDVEAVGEHQGVAGLQIGGDVLPVQIRLGFIVDEDHDDVGPPGGLGYAHDLQSGGLRLGLIGAAGPQAHAYVAAGLLQVQGVGVALGAVADDADLPAVQLADIAVLLIIHLCHIPCSS